MTTDETSIQDIIASAFRNLPFSSPRTTYCRMWSDGWKITTLHEQSWGTMSTVSATCCKRAPLTSTRQRTIRVIDSGHITLDTKMAVFVVKGTNEPRVVRLFPKPSCSSPAQTQCYHMQAARMAVGLHEEYNWRPINLKQLRKCQKMRWQDIRLKTATRPWRRRCPGGWRWTRCRRVIHGSSNWKTRQ